MSAAKTHEERLDQVAKLRVKRDTPPLVYSPYSPGEQGEAPSPLRPQNDNELEEVLAMIVEKDPERHLSLTDAYEAHVEGTRRNKGASKLCLHAFVQFPTDLKLTSENEHLMLAQAVHFVNRHHGGKAVFHARIDRDEEGRHGVDVFYAPKYIKATKRRSEEWVSLTKFGKELAIERFGQKPKEAKTNEKDQETGKPIWKPVLDASGDPIMVDCDSSYYQGQTLQDLFFEHLRDRMGLAWAQRGEKKVGRDPDRLGVEEYKLKQEREMLEKQRQANIAEAIERNCAVERAGKSAQKARDLMMQGAKEQEEASKSRVADLEKKAARLEAQLESLSEQIREAQKAEARIRDLGAYEGNLRASVARSERLLDDIKVEEAAALASVSDLQGKIEALETRQTSLHNGVQLSGDGAENFEIAMQEVARVTDAAGQQTLNKELLETAQNRAFYDNNQKHRRFAQSDQQDSLIIKFIRFGFQKAVDLFNRIKDLTVFNDQLERAQTFPEPLKQMQNNLTGMREAISETLRQIGVADQCLDVGEQDEKGDPPPVLELVLSRAARKTQKLNNELVARMAPAGPRRG